MSSGSQQPQDDMRILTLAILLVGISSAVAARSLRGLSKEDCWVYAMPSTVIGEDPAKDKDGDYPVLAWPGTIKDLNYGEAKKVADTFCKSVGYKMSGAFAPRLYAAFIWPWGTSTMDGKQRCRSSGPTDQSVMDCTAYMYITCKSSSSISDNCGIHGNNIGFGNKGPFNVGNFNKGRGNNGDWNAGNFNTGSYQPRGSNGNVGFFNKGNGNSGINNEGEGNQGTNLIGQGNSGKDIKGQGNQGYKINGQGNSGNNINGSGNSGNNINGLGNAGNNINGQGNSGNNINGLGNAGNNINGLGNSGNNINGEGLSGENINY